MDEKYSIHSLPIDGKTIVENRTKLGKLVPDYQIDQSDAKLQLFVCLWTLFTTQQPILNI